MTTWAGRAGPDFAPGRRPRASIASVGKQGDRSGGGGAVVPPSTLAGSARSARVPQALAASSKPANGVCSGVVLVRSPG